MLFDALAGAIVPVEGRVWLGGVPVTLSSRRQIQRLVHVVDLGVEPYALAARILAAIDHARARHAEFLLLRNVDTTSDQHALDGIAAFLRRIVSTERLTIVASTRLPGPLHGAAHVTVTLEDRAARVVVA